MLFLQHRLQRAEGVRVEIERDPREEVIDEMEVLEHVEPIDDRLDDRALHPEHIGVAIALMDLMRLMGEVGEEVDDERASQGCMARSTAPALRATSRTPRARRRWRKGLGRPPRYGW